MGFSSTIAAVYLDKSFFRAFSIKNSLVVINKPIEYYSLLIVKGIILY